MKTKECPACAMNVPAKSRTCQVCGYEFSTNRYGLQVLALLLALLFLYLIFF